MEIKRPYLDRAARLKKIRGDISAEVFAKDLGININTYYRYERGETPISDGHLKLAEIFRMEVDSKAGKIAEPEKQYDQHGGYKPDPEKALGVERGTQQWKAFELLSKIYASADQQLIGAIFSNLKSFADAADQKRENVELKRKVDELDVRLNEMAGQLNQKGIIRFIERRSGADRRRASCKCTTDIERRSGGDRRKDVVNNGATV
jgi:transcriptional regulator with XRE-family HTH domain